MSSYRSNIDFQGAPSSNSGDQFHELWALQQALKLLNPDTNINAVSVEGVMTTSRNHDVDSPNWDSVDCALYYGAETIEKADRIEFIQCKYSSADADKNWTTSRLIKNTAKSKNNSVIRKMAEDFKNAKKRIRQGTDIKIRLVSNQDISAKVKKAIETQWSGLLKDAQIADNIKSILVKLKQATGLSEVDFKDFLKNLDFSECGTHSRFSIREKVVKAVTSLLGDDVLTEVRELQIRIREKMLPESIGESITDKDILLWLGISSRDGLFPCRSYIRMPDNPLKRSIAKEAAQLLLKGNRVVLIHGNGGCGKTTLVNQIIDHLPDQSEMVLFDCYGGGRYLYSNDNRHLPENAFLHLVNEISVKINIPLFIPREAKHPVNIKTFYNMLQSAGNAFSKISFESILLIVIDAADNSVIAAENSNHPERSFIFDLFKSGLTDLPNNIRFVVSCRTSRRNSLNLPRYAIELLCPPFTIVETGQHLKSFFHDINTDLIGLFHKLTSGNPRVQTYAIENSNKEPGRLIDSLLPCGKDLPDILNERFERALTKLGKSLLFDRLVGLLAYMPPPISLFSISKMVGCSIETVEDLGLDLSPGIQINDNGLTVSDEDFEAYIKNISETSYDKIVSEMADYFFVSFQSDPYSSIHVGATLLKAGRARDILTVIEQDPQVSAIDDPVVRHQIQVERRTFSLSACAQKNSMCDALKIILISAEAEYDKSTIEDVLFKELDLSVEFSDTSMRRRILMDRNQIKKHGSFLAQDAVRAIRKGDHSTAREQLLYHDAWLRKRADIPEMENHDWIVTDRDIAARVESIFELAGPKSASNELFRWRPRNVALRAAFILIPQYISSGNFHKLDHFMKVSPPKKPWDLVILVPKAMAGLKIDCIELENSLSRIQKAYIPDVGGFHSSFDEENWMHKLVDTFITACELSFSLRIDSITISLALNQIMEAFKNTRKHKIFLHDVFLIDGIIRCWILSKHILGEVVNQNDFFEYLVAFNKEKINHARKMDKTNKKDSTFYEIDQIELNNIKNTIEAIFPVYSARITILSLNANNSPITEKHINDLSNMQTRYYFENDYYGSKLLDIVARSVMNLLIINCISSSDLFSQSFAISCGKNNDLFAIKREYLWNLMRLRTNDSEELVRAVSISCHQVKDSRESSSKKMNVFIRLCRLLLHISRNDALAIFNDAIEIVNEIDLEAFDQIAFLSNLSENYTDLSNHNKRAIAYSLYSFITDSAERLSEYDGFPWQSAINSITQLDFIVGLSAVSKWSDTGLTPFDKVFDKLLLVALQKGNISVEIAVALSLLIDGSLSILRNEILSHIQNEPLKSINILEELSRETLLITESKSRHILGRDIIEILSNPSKDYIWLNKLNQMVIFFERYHEEKSEVIEIYLPNQSYFSNDGDTLPSKYDFNPTGMSFTTSDSIEFILKQAAQSGLYFHQHDLISKMIKYTSNPDDKVLFLNALSTINREYIWSWDRLNSIYDALTAWMHFPSIKRWCIEKLPSIIVKYFDGFSLGTKSRDSLLHKLLSYTNLSLEARSKLILKGVAFAGETMNSRVLFEIAEDISKILSVGDTSELLSWYSQRLCLKLPACGPSNRVLQDLPTDYMDALARFILAQFSDIDKRIRWKTAHILRRLAIFGCDQVINSLISQSNRTDDISFRDSDSPYYSFAAKLWLSITLYRICIDNPSMVSAYKTEILNFATSPQLPHVIINEYSKRSITHLYSIGAIDLNVSERVAVEQINKPIKGLTNELNRNCKALGNRFYQGKRFSFNSYDTISYWYEKALRLFPTVTMEQFLTIAEHWIIDKWGFSSDAAKWDSDPRKKRYENLRWVLYSNDHGSIPTVERLSTYLEWHAMHATVSQLLKSHPISDSEDSFFGNFDNWIEDNFSSESPQWLFDIRVPVPFETRFWMQDSRKDKNWLRSVRRDEFLSEIGLLNPDSDGWIVINGYHKIEYPRRDVNTHIRSALVSPTTALSLVRALQTTNDPMDFRIPYEYDELEIDKSPYFLKGWVASYYTENSIDIHDPFRNETQPVMMGPGQDFTQMFQLHPRPGFGRTWTCQNTNEPIMFYESWSDKPAPEERHYRLEIRSHGTRLWAKSDAVLTFLETNNMDLIFEVQIERRLRNELIGGFDEKKDERKIHEKIFLLRRDGSIIDASKRIGTWTRNSKRVKS